MYNMVHLDDNYFSPQYADDNGPVLDSVNEDEAGGQY